MDPVGREAMRKCQQQLVSDLDPSLGLLDFLLGHSAEANLPDARYEELLSVEPRHRRAQQFLCYARTSCPFPLLLQALESGPEHRHLATALQQEHDLLLQSHNAPAAALPERPEVTSREVSVDEKDEEEASKEERRVGDVSVQVLTQSLTQSMTQSLTQSLTQSVTQSMTEAIARAVVAQVTPQLGKRTNLHRSEEESEGQGRRLLPSQGKQLRRDTSMAVDFPRGPARVTVGGWRKGDPLSRLCRSILHIQFGKVSCTEKEASKVRALLRHNPQVRDNADAGFLAAAMSVQFGLGDKTLGNMDDMERLYPLTRNPQLSLVVLLTMKGHQATVEGRTLEAQGYLDSARITSRQLEPCAETLYCLRTFACLKRELFYASGERQDGRKLEEVLLHAKEVTEEMGLREDNSGTVMVLNRQAARFYMGFHPWKNPPFKGTPHAFHLQSAQHALHDAERCMRQMDRQPEDDSIHCLASAALCFLRQEQAGMDRWLEKGSQAKVTYRNFHTDAQRLRMWASEHSDMSERRE